MNIKQKWLVPLGAVLVTGALMTGVAFADTAVKAPVAPGQKQVTPLSPAQTEIVKKLQDLRKSYMEKYKTESKAIIDQAVKDGKLTQDEATRLERRGGKFFGPGHHGMKGGMKGGFHGAFWGATQEEVKAKLDEAVKAGKLTQEKADLILKQWTEHHQEKQAQ